MARHDRPSPRSALRRAAHHDAAIPVLWLGDAEFAARLHHAGGAWLGLPYEVRPVNIRAREQFAPEIVALNPCGKIPILVLLWQKTVSCCRFWSPLSAVA